MSATFNAWRVTGIAGRRRAAGLLMSPAVLDTALACGLLLVSVLLGHEVPPADWRRLDAAGYLLAGAATLPVLARRRLPRTVLVACCGSWAVFVWAGFWPVVTSMGPLLALYSLVAYGGLRDAAWGMLLLDAVWIYGGLDAAHSDMGSVVAQALVMPSVLVVFGLQSRHLHERTEQLADLADRLRQEQASRAEHAVARERLRIARELHDVVAHHLSVVSVQSGLADYVFEADPPTARAALRTIALTSAEALEEMRGLLNVLRWGMEAGQGAGSEDEACLSPAPGLTRLVGLAERMRDAGVHVKVRVTGRERPLARGVELCAYRIVQEALTNVLKHAAPTAAEVSLHYGPGHLTGRITDEGPQGDRAGAHVAGSGNGLIGMHERVRIYGGTLRAAAREEGGFEVVFTLPADSQGDTHTAHDPGAGRV